MVYSKEQTQIPIYLQMKGGLIMSMPFDQNKMLTGTDFDDNVAKLLSDIGFKEVKLMRRDNKKDHGVDIIASKKVNKKIRLFQMFMDKLLYNILSFFLTGQFNEFVIILDFVSRKDY